MKREADLKKNTFPDYYNTNNQQKYRVDIKWENLFDISVADTSKL